MAAKFTDVKNNLQTMRDELSTQLQFKLSDQELFTAETAVTESAGRLAAIQSKYKAIEERIAHLDSAIAFMDAKDR